MREMVWISTVCAYCATAAVADTPQSDMAAIEIVIVDEDATGYGTFQSHNQKIVSNRFGIFMTHLRSRNREYTDQTWRLSRSTDGGKSFATLHEASRATNPPVLETDAAGTIYLALPDFVDGHAYLYRFAPPNFDAPSITRIPGGAAGKFAMHYDAHCKQLYFFAHNNRFFVIRLDGEIRRSERLLNGGPDAVLQYPLLSLAPTGELFAAWTTQKRGVYLYWDIHAMRSDDGAARWQRLDGTALTTPVVADHHGPSDRLTLDDEFESHTWLSSLGVKDGALHAAYLAQTQPPRQHYVRYDLRQGRVDRRIQPEWRGQSLSVQNLDGFFATRAAEPESPLYYVSRDPRDSRIACLVSRDNGETWHDFAASREPRRPYAIGGCREVAADGRILGSFTEALETNDRAKMDPARVFFFSIQTPPSKPAVP